MTEVELQQYLLSEYPQENTWYGWVFKIQSLCVSK